MINSPGNRAVYLTTIYWRNNMHDDEIISNAIAQVIIHVSEEHLRKLIDAENMIGYANMHYGLNAQVVANTHFRHCLNQAVDGIPDYYKAEMLKRLKGDSK
jgi:hypothetical protein